MADQKRRSRGSIRVDLTPQQREALKELGYNGPADFVEVDVEELEDRIVPAACLQ